MSSPVIDNTIKDRYFFIDYLRLHKFGRQNNIWLKNRNMLVKKDEYTGTNILRARKGYKAYIQRCMKSILEWLYKDFDIIKPRNRFAYEIGKKNDTDDVLDLTSEKAEEKIKYVLCRYITDRKYVNIVEEYKRIMLNNPFLKFKNREAGLIINLDPKRSFGYEALRNLMQVRVIQDKMIKIGEDKDGIIKELLHSLLVKTASIPIGSNVVILDNNNMPTTTTGKVKELRDVESRYGTRREYIVKEDTFSEGDYTNIYRMSQIRLLDQATLTVVSSLESLTQRVVDYANEFFSGTSGLNAEAIYSLSRSTIVRQLITEGNIEMAGQLRQQQPTLAILDKMPRSHHEEEEEDNYEEVEMDNDEEEN